MSIGKKLRFETFKRDRFTCCYCGQRPPDVVLEVDHVLAKANGGTDDMTNLTTACFSCNRGKGANDLGDVAPAVDEMALMASVQEMLERRTLLQASIQVARSKEAAKDDAVEVLEARWAEVISANGFQEKSARLFLDKMSFDAIWDAIDVVDGWIERTEWRGADATWRYFCGVCWTIIRDGET